MAAISVAAVVGISMCRAARPVAQAALVAAAVAAATQEAPPAETAVSVEAKGGTATPLPMAVVAAAAAPALAEPCSTHKAAQLRSPIARFRATPLRAETVATLAVVPLRAKKEVTA